MVAMVTYPHFPEHLSVNFSGEDRSSSLKSGRNTKAMMNKEITVIGTHAGLMILFLEELKIELSQKIVTFGSFFLSRYQVNW